MSQREQEDQDHVSFGELVRMVRRIDERTAGMAMTLPDLDKRVTILEVIHPEESHEPRGGSSLGRWLALIGTVVFSAIAGAGAAIANFKNGGVH